MWIYVWDSEIKWIYLWDTLVKEVYLWDTKIRPTTPSDLSFNFTDWTRSVSWAKSDWWLFYGDESVVTFWTGGLQRDWGTTSAFNSRWWGKSPFMYKKFLNNIQWLKEITISVDINWYSSSTWDAYSLSHLIYFFWDTVIQNGAYLPWNTRNGWLVRSLSIYSMGNKLTEITPDSFLNTWIYKYNFITWAYELSYSGRASWVAVSGTDPNLNQVKNMLWSWLYIWAWMDYIWWARQSTAWIRALSIHFEME